MEQFLICFLRPDVRSYHRAFDFEVEKMWSAPLKKVLYNLLICFVRFIKIELSGSAGTSVTHHGLQAVLTLEDLHTLHLNNTRDRIYREKSKNFVKPF